VRLAASCAVAAAGGAFLLGRATAPSARIPGPGGGYLALRRGGPGITYAFARRWPLAPGREYRACRPQIVCSRPAR
jgi:hypothetical protein